MYYNVRAPYSMWEERNALCGNAFGSTYRILKKVFQNSVSPHFALHHDKDPALLKFWAIEKYKLHWWGSNKVRELSKSESKWIFEMGTLAHFGLNIDFDINCFISDF